MVTPLVLFPSVFVNIKSKMKGKRISLPARQSAFLDFTLSSKLRKPLTQAFDSDHKLVGSKRNHPIGGRTGLLFIFPSTNGFTYLVSFSSKKV